MYVLPAVKDTHSVTVTFQLPSLQAAYAAKVSVLLCQWRHTVVGAVAVPARDS